MWEGGKRTGRIAAGMAAALVLFAPLIWIACISMIRDGSSTWAQCQGWALRTGAPSTACFGVAGVPDDYAPITGRRYQAVSMDREPSGRASCKPVRSRRLDPASGRSSERVYLTSGETPDPAASAKIVLGTEQAKDLVRGAG